MKCKPVELSFDKHFSSTFSSLDQAFQRCLHRSYSESITGKYFEGIWGERSDLLEKAS